MTFNSNGSGSGSFPNDDFFKSMIFCRDTAVGFFGAAVEMTFKTMSGSMTMASFLASSNQMFTSTLTSNTPEQPTQHPRLVKQVEKVAYVRFPNHFRARQPDAGPPVR